MANTGHFEIIPRLHNQSNANDICQNKGGHLPRIASDREIKEFRQFTKINNVWMDLQKLSYRSPRWIDGSTTGKLSLLHL